MPNPDHQRHIFAVARYALRRYQIARLAHDESVYRLPYGNPSRLATEHEEYRQYLRFQAAFKALREYQAGTTGENCAESARNDAQRA